MKFFINNFLKLTCMCIIGLIAGCGAGCGAGSREDVSERVNDNKNNAFIEKEMKVILKIGSADNARYKELIIINPDFEGLDKLSFAIKLLDEEKNKLTPAEENKPLSIWLFVKNNQKKIDAVLIDASRTTGHDSRINLENFEEYAKAKLDLYGYPYKKQLDVNGNFIKY